MNDLNGDRPAVPVLHLPDTSLGVVFNTAPGGDRVTSANCADVGFDGLPPHARLRLGAATKPFGLSVINDVGALMTESFRLRYQVYCIERQFLPAADYPGGLEIDQFDETSVHVGALDSRGRLAGTARLILPFHDTLPTLSHCPLTAVTGPLWGVMERWVEVSRLSVSRQYRSSNQMNDVASPEVHSRGDILLAVSKAVYLASKRLHATHWLVSIERSLQRLLSRNGFPFRQLGPQFDYLGPVAPYSMDLAEFETIARSGRYPPIIDFLSDEEESDDRKVSALPFVAAALMTLRGEQSHQKWADASV